MFYPAYYINWYDAITYCNLRSKADNLTPVYSITVNDEESFNESVDPTLTNQAVPITDRGTVQVKVFIDGTRYNTTQINLSETQKLTIDTRN